MEGCYLILLHASYIRGEVKDDPKTLNFYSTDTSAFQITPQKEKDIFDLSKLFVGSQGTLGIITEITLELVLTEKRSRMFVSYLFSLDNLAKIVQEILKLNPTSLEAYDDKTLKLALKYAPEIAKMIRQEENLFMFALDLLRQKIKNRQAVPCIDDIIVNPSHMPEFLPELNKILENYPQLIYTIAGHAGNGNFHIILLVGIPTQAKSFNPRNFRRGL